MEEPAVLSRKVERATLRIKWRKLHQRYMYYGGTHTPWTTQLVSQMREIQTRLRILDALDNT